MTATTYISLFLVKLLREADGFAVESGFLTTLCHEDSTGLVSPRLVLAKRPHFKFRARRKTSNAFLWQAMRNARIARNVSSERLCIAEPLTIYKPGLFPAPVLYGSFAASNSAARLLPILHRSPPCTYPYIQSCRLLLFTTNSTLRHRTWVEEFVQRPCSMAAQAKVGRPLRSP